MAERDQAAAMLATRLGQGGTFAVGKQGILTKGRRDSCRAAGLVPEELLQVLITKRVDYYFCKMCPLTDPMMNIFFNVYADANAVFEVLVRAPPHPPTLPWKLRKVLTASSAEWATCGKTCHCTVALGLLGCARVYCPS